MKKSGLRQEYYDCEIVYRDKIKKALSEMLLEKHLQKMTEFFKVLGDETRLKILNMLENNSLCVCAISAGLDMTKSAISHQLKKLRELNLVKAEKIGKEVWYSLADDHIKKVFDISAEHIMEGEDG